MDRTLPHALPLLAALALLSACGEADLPDDELQPVRGAEIARIVPAQQAISGANVPTLDPHTLNDAEIAKAIGTGPRCVFRYTSTGKPVVAVSAVPGADQTAGGIIKLNGNLVTLAQVPADPAGRELGNFMLVAEPIRLAVKPAPGEPSDGPDGGQRREADMIFEIGQDLRAGYRGYLDCRPGPSEES